MSIREVIALTVWVDDQLMVCKDVIAGEWRPGRQSVKFEEILKSHTFAVILDTLTDVIHLLRDLFIHLHLW